MSIAPGETIRIETANRWDAVDLVRRLQGLHTYLVQLGDSRWLVCVRAEGDADELVPVVLERAAEWAHARRASSVMRVGERTYEIAD